MVFCSYLHSTELPNFFKVRLLMEHSRRFLNKEIQRTVDRNVDRVAVLRVHGLGHDDHRVVAVNPVSAHRFQPKLRLCPVGAHALLVELSGVVEKVEIKGTRLARRRARGRDVVSLGDKTFVEVENGQRQAWKSDQERNVRENIMEKKHEEH